MLRADCFLSSTEQGSATRRSGRFDNRMRAEGAPKLGGWRLGSFSTHVPCVDHIFNDLVADLGGEKSCITRVEPTSPAKSLKTNKLKLAERVGFEPTCRLPDKTLSRRPRYDHFGTSPVEGRALNTTLYPALFAEELLDEFPGLFLAHAAGDAEAMVQPRRVERAHGRHQRAGLRLRGSINHVPNTRVDERADAHQARLDRDVKIGARQAIVADDACSVAQDEDLRVRGRVTR